MKPFESHKFCPRCGKGTSIVSSYILKCSSCELNFFQSFKPACNAIIVNEKNEILVSKRAIEPKKGTYDCPGGFIGLDETAEEALKRELKEELGLDLEVEPENYVGSFYVDYEYQGINYDVLIFHFAVYVNSTITDLIKPQDDVESVEFIDHKKAEEILGWHGDIKAIKKFFNL